MQIARQPVSTKNANPKECDTHRTQSLRYREMAYLLVPNTSSKKKLSIQKIHPAVVQIIWTWEDKETDMGR